MSRWEAWVNHLGWGLTAASGIVYGILKYFATGSDPDSRLAHPWQPAALAVHVLAAPVAVFALGLIFRRHALARFVAEQERGRRSGSPLTYLAIPLAFSGYLIQAMSGEAARRWTGWVHAAAGLVFALAYGAHFLRSRSPDDAAETAAEP